MFCTMFFQGGGEIETVFGAELWYCQGNVSFLLLKIETAIIFKTFYEKSIFLLNSMKCLFYLQ